jgi:hypothetical protein
MSEMSASGHETVMMHLAKESKSAICDPNDADLIQRCEYEGHRSAAIGTDAGPLYTVMEMPRVYKYAPPLPYASQSIYLAVHTTKSTVLQCFVRVLYTIRSVSDKYFFRVAQALLG